MIVSPPHRGSYPDRQRQCQQALEVEFDDIIQRAVQAGWTEDDVEQALLALSVAYMKEHQRDARIYAQIRRAARTVEGE